MSTNEKNKFTASDTIKKAGKKDGKKISFITVGSIIILILSAITFIFVPAMTGYSTQDTEAPVIGSYKGQEIKYESGTDFASYMEQYSNQIKESGYDVDQYLYSIINSAFNSTVVTMAIEDYVDDSKYITPDSAVNREMRKQFQDEDGNFSVKLYNEADKTTVQKLFTQTEKQLKLTRYISDFIGMGTASYFGNTKYAGGAKLSSNEASFITGMDNNKRKFQLVAYKANELPEEEYIAYAKAHPEHFAKYTFSIITADTEDAAKKIAAQINNNEITFEDALDSLSTHLDMTDNGSIEVYDYQIKENLLADESDYAALTALKKGQISDAIHTQTYGYAVLRCDKEKTATDPEDESLQSILGAYVRVYEQGYMQDYYASKAAVFAAAAARDGFAEAAEANGLEVIEPTAFSLNYNNIALLTSVPSSTYEQLTGAEKNEEFLKKAFSLSLNQISEPMVVGNYIVVMKYVESVPVDEAISSSMAYMYPYYTSSYSQSSMESTILDSADIKNDVMSFYFQYILGYSY